MIGKEEFNLNNTDKISSSHKRNTAGLEKARQELREKCNRKVDVAIQTILNRQESISFYKVAKLAGVSKKYLYDNHFDRINALREKQDALSLQKVLGGTAEEND